MRQAHLTCFRVSQKIVLDGLILKTDGDLTIARYGEIDRLPVLLTRTQNSTSPACFVSPFFLNTSFFSCNSVLFLLVVPSPLLLPTKVFPAVISCNLGITYFPPQVHSRQTMLEHVLPPFSAASLGLTSLVPAIQSNDLGKDLDASAPAGPAPGLDHLKNPVVEHVRGIELETPEFDLNATQIKSSPYSDPLNFLNLTELDQPLCLFALALTKLQNVRPDYATAPYMSSFNWDEVFSILRGLCEQTGTQWQGTDFYVVIFRSKLRAEADRARLGELDQMSHQEACASGGLLTYWFGSPDDERRNLATCKCCPRQLHLSI